MTRSENTILMVFKDNPADSFNQAQLAKRTMYTQASVSIALRKLMATGIVAESHQEQLNERGPMTTFYKLAGAMQRQQKEQQELKLKNEAPVLNFSDADAYIYAPCVHQQVIEIRALYEMIEPY